MNKQQHTYQLPGLLTFAALLLMSFTTSNTSSKAALTEVSKIFDKLNLSASEGKNVCYLNYTVTAKLNSKETNGQNIISTSQFELITNKNQSRIISKEMMVLKDEENTITILPSRKMIYLADAVNGNKNENLYAKLKPLQDSIFKHSEKVETEDVKGKTYNKIITIQLDQKMANFIDIESASYYINTDTQVLNKVVVNYLPNKQYQQLEYNFNEVSFNYNKVNMQAPVKKQVFEHGKNLKKEYQDFKVIDNRKK